MWLLACSFSWRVTLLLTWPKFTSKEARVNSKRFAERCWEHPFSGIWDRTCFLTNYTWSLRVLCSGAFWITRFSIGWSCKLQEAPNVKYLTNCCCFFKVFYCFWLATMEELYITLWSALRTTWVWVYSSSAFFALLQGAVGGRCGTNASIMF